jgi:flavin reductase (DIM6/NTAB) family NADH-FMN oxidoreductase RutF
LGSHDLFLAEAVAVHVDETVLDKKGGFDAAKAKLFTFLPQTGDYWQLGEQLKESAPDRQIKGKTAGHR